jgi:hypothetical protein
MSFGRAWGWALAMTVVGCGGTDGALGANSADPSPMPKAATTSVLAAPDAGTPSVSDVKPSEACVPATCEDLGFVCGAHGDTCGGSINCGPCEDAGDSTAIDSGSAAIDAGPLDVAPVADSGASQEAAVLAPPESCAGGSLHCENGATCGMSIVPVPGSPGSFSRAQDCCSPSDYQDGTPPTCVPIEKKASGGSCSYGNECSSGHCVVGGLWSSGSCS